MNSALAFVDSPKSPILIAHPEDDLRQIYCAAFRNAAWECDEARDGREALVKTLTYHPAALVTSTALPFIDGFTLAQLLRNDSETRTLPIILMAPDPALVDERRASMVGADAIVARPSPEILLAEMRRLVSHSRELRGRAEAARSRMAEQVVRSAELLDRSAKHQKQLVRSHLRYKTMVPPLAPPQPRCPDCDRLLEYKGSHIGGVSSLHAEQWDYFDCAQHGEFQYRQRTRKLRHV